MKAKLPWRSALYMCVLLYLLLDLKVCHGPLKKRIAESRPSSDITREKAAARGWVALVNQEPVTSQQLSLAVARYLYQRGKEWQDIPRVAQTRIQRATLRRLIDDVLIRQYADGDDYQAPDAEIASYIAAWESQFPSPQSLTDRSRDQSLSKKEREAQLARIWSHKRWLEQRIEPGIGVTDQMVRDWYEVNVAAGNLREPEKVRVRHIFASTVQADSDTQREKIEVAREQVLDGIEFAEVAREVSEDQRTKDRGGELGWLSRARVPTDFADVVFSHDPGLITDPFQTSIGWHIAEVLEHRPERDSTYEEVEAEIRAYLLNTQRKDTVDRLLGKLRKVANIVIFTENL